jgi:hypothetical protein
MGQFQLTSSLPGLFQQSYVGSLLKSNQGGGGIGSMMNNSLGGLGFGGLTGGLTGGNMMAGTNPLNPLQGASDLQGLGGFVNQVQTMGALRQMGYLPSTQKSSSSGGGDLMSQMMSMFSMLQSMMGSGSAESILGGGQANGNGDDSTAEQLAGMLSMMQALMGSLGGQTQTVSAPVAQMPGANAFAGNLGGMAGLGGNMQGLGGMSGFGGGGFFSGIGDGFASIDSAINQTVGSVLGSLSLAKL